MATTRKNARKGPRWGLGAKPGPAGRAVPTADPLVRWLGLEPYLLSVLRVMAAALFFLHGSTKLLAFPAPVMPDGGTAQLASLAGIAGLLELVGGALLLVGLLTRPVAFVLSGQMAVAYFHGHAGRGFWPVLNGGELALLYCFLFLYISAAGPGPWSLDALRRPHTPGAGSRR